MMLLDDNINIVLFSLCRCNVRTTFDGPSFSTQCQENGAWTHPPPKCWGSYIFILHSHNLYTPKGIFINIKKQSYLMASSHHQ